MQQPCGAYLQPAWYTGNSWATCNGKHATVGAQAGWHKTGRRGPDLRVTAFATHHMVAWSGPARCACGEPWPCATAEARATDPLRPQSAAPSAPGCDLVWHDGSDHMHVCRNPTPAAPHICQTCGGFAHPNATRP